MDVETSVIIPAHDAAATLAVQLEALCAQRDAPAFEVVVVANRCTDATAEVAQGFADRLVLRVVTADDGVGVAYARNAGAARASGRFLLFCDADDEVGPDWVAALTAALRPGERSIVGGRVEVDRAGLPDWLYRWRLAYLDGTCVQGQDRPMPSVLGGAVGVTAEAFRAAGGYDERFAGTGCEDTHFSWRVLQSGGRLGEVPAATLRYVQRSSVRSVLRQNRARLPGHVLLAAIEGTLTPSVRVRSLVRRLCSSTAYLVLRMGVRNPVELYARARVDLDLWRAQRRMERAGVLDGVVPTMEREFTAPLATPIIGGLALAAVRRDDARYYAAGGVEPMALAVLERFLSPGAVAVDVGANIGVFSVAAARCVGPTGTVHTFEPAARAAGPLAENLRRHGVADVVRVHRCAAAAEPGRRPFAEHENGLLSGLGPAPACFDPGPVVDDGAVDVVRLSDAVPGVVDLLKIDVEGFEPEVLQGAAELLERSPALVLLAELNPASLALAGHSPDAMLDLLPEDEWDLWLIDERRPVPLEQLPRIDRRRLASLLPADERWYATVLGIRRGSGLTLS